MYLPPYRNPACSMTPMIPAFAFAGAAFMETAPYLGVRSVTNARKARPARGAALD
jgi:hypothetical protein